MPRQTIMNAAKRNSRPLPTRLSPEGLRDIQKLNAMIDAMRSSLGKGNSHPKRIKIPPVVTAQQAAKRLRLSRWQVYRYANRGILVAIYKDGTRRRWITKASLEAYQQALEQLNQQHQ